jgi:AraC family transcriptional regulator
MSCTPDVHLKQGDTGPDEIACGPANRHYEPFAVPSTAAGERDLLEAEKFDCIVVRLPSMRMVVKVSTARSCQSSADLSTETLGSFSNVERLVQIQASRQQLLRCIVRLSSMGGNCDECAYAEKICDPLLLRMSRVIKVGDLHAIQSDAMKLAIITHLLSDDELKTAQDSDRSGNSGLPKWRLKRVVEYIDTHLEGTITLRHMAEASGLSRMHFAAQFRIATGLRPHEFVMRRRVEGAQSLMIGSEDTLADIALAMGFKSQAYFTTVFSSLTGETPHRWRRRNKVEELGQS